MEAIAATTAAATNVIAKAALGAPKKARREEPPTEASHGLPSPVLAALPYQPSREQLSMLARHELTNRTSRPSA